MKIQTPKCSRENPLFSLTVAISSRNPSRALRRTETGRFWFRFTPERKQEALKGVFHLAQQPPWKVWDPRKGNSRTPRRSPERQRQQLMQQNKSGKERVHVVHGGHLLGEQPEPGRARWRKADRSQGLVNTAAPADERTDTPPLTWTGSWCTAAQGHWKGSITRSDFVHAASPDVLTRRTHLKLLGLWWILNTLYAPKKRSSV